MNKDYVEYLLRLKNALDSAEKFLQANKPNYIWQDIKNYIYAMPIVE